MKTLFDSGDLQVVRLTSSEASTLLRLFGSIALEQGWDPGSDLDAYSDHAVYFAARRSGHVIGGIKLVMGNSDTLPVSGVWPETGLLGRIDVADLALLALLHEHRGDLTALWTVCVEMWRHCVDKGIHEVWAELPPRNLRLYRRLGWPFKEMGALREHWGEPCLPCRMLVSDAHAVVASRARQSILFQSVLDQAFRQGDE